jgi:LysM repeat protein
MTDEKEYKDDEEVEEHKEEEKVEKSAFDSSLQALTETIKGFDINGLKDEIKGISAKVDTFDARIKAMEEPTDLPLKPKVSAEDDIGAQVKVPDDYQSNSNQAGIKDSDEENAKENDKNNLSMQEKSLDSATFTTETPRPGAALETVEKSAGVQMNEVLKASREAGYEDLGAIGRRILKGEFGSPEQGDSQW